ncbi:hypothetical protein SBI_00121 [Streptomyces bingchenggensis BCW-1]|uniref:Uncharacterized protein n=1 Tax=Streptomyces bingchenggensis (strain BCW-1) TaxID=749414 RepID=D7BUQ1_STRBB|nr:hypothetical protein SBI_00121 [Streptomyces bingchenggensis BCW-1]
MSVPLYQAKAVRDARRILTALPAGRNELPAGLREAGVAA